MKKLFILALKNLRSYRKYNLKLMFTVASLVFLASLFFVYIISLANKHEELKNKNSSSNYLISDKPLVDADKLLPSDYVLNQFNYFAFEVIAKEYFNREINYVSFNDIIIEYQSKKYFIENKKYDTGEIIIEAPDPDTTGWFNIFSGNVDELFFKNDYKEYKLSNGHASFIEGQLPSKANEILISENLLNRLGLDKNILGKAISILPKEAPSIYILKDVIISGIIKRDYYQLSGHDGFHTFSPILFIHSDSDLVQKNFELFREVNLYSFNDYLSEKTSQELMSNYDAIYIGSYIIGIMKSIKSMQILTSRLFSIVGIALAIGIILTLYLLISKYSQVFSRSSGILLTNGISKKSLYGLLYIQLMIIGIVALIVSLGLTTGVFLLVEHFIAQIYYLDFDISLLFVLRLFIINSIAIVLIISLFYLYIWKKTRNNTIRNFLTTQVI